MKTDMPRPIRLEDYEPPAYLIDTVALDVALAPRATRVIAKLKLKPNPAATSGKGPLRLDGDNLNLESISLDGAPLPQRAFVRTETSLAIADPPRRPFTLEIVTVCDPDSNKALQGLYRSRGVYCTQCEAQGFRRITYFLDRPDVLSVYTTRIEADPEEAPVLLANGNLRERGKLDRGRRHYAVWHDPHPKPCYLFALVGGKLTSIADEFRTMSGRRVELQIYVEPGKADRAHYAMDALKRSMRWDEQVFGREYDLDVFNIVAVSDFNMGAMENKGLNVFNDRLVLASPTTTTDAGYEAIEAVVAHEYFHNWTGNRITCRDWFQLCLKEGLTVFRDQEFSSDARSRPVQRIQDVRQLRAAQFPEDAGPLAHPVRPKTYIEINNFYTATVYEKGAEVVRMLKLLLGDKAFRRGMDLYFDRHDGEAVTIEDFLACFAEVSGRDLGQFMLWYTQAGTPELKAKFSYSKASRSARLDLTQVNPPTPGETRKKPMLVPLKMALLGPDGADLALKATGHAVRDDGLVEITGKSTSIVFRDLDERPVPSLGRGFSAPIRLSLEQSDDDLVFLAGHDRDLFNRWQAGQTLALRILLKRLKGDPDGTAAASEQAFAGALERALTDEASEPAFKAEILRLPSEADIAGEVRTDINPSSIHRTRRTVVKRLARRLGPTLERIFAALAPKAGAFSPDAESAGRRALRNQAVALLAARGTPDDIARLARQARHADNMTEEAFALVALSQIGGPEAEAALKRFESRWRSDNLVIDTWFAAQAMAPQAATIGKVRALMQHPCFAITQPNKVRALVSNFAFSNPVQFNRPDGRGYRLVAGVCLKLDAFNPQMAARLLTSFRATRMLEARRRAAARDALERVRKHPQLSRDVHEMVSRMLEA